MASSVEFVKSEVHGIEKNQCITKEYIYVHMYIYIKTVSALSRGNLSYLQLTRSLHLAALQKPENRVGMRAYFKVSQHCTLYTGFHLMKCTVNGFQKNIF